MAHDPTHILVVDDSPGDRFLVYEALRIHSPRLHLHFLDNGEEAVHFLFRRGVYATAPRPALVLLDHVLPRLSGREIIDRMDGDEALREIPVALFTTVAVPSELALLRNRAHTRFVVKPTEPDEFIAAVRAVVAEALKLHPGGLPEDR